ncbi:CU044_2847 family protein [Streptomyces sp. NPDC052016]|uniref:CU044_2847 family protein n=1 Tax=Streptomyces sp. NPDC052016 TaxID=3365680 RepID=UPI0037CE2F12
MAGVVEFRTDDGAVVAVEAVEEQRPGSRLVARGDGTVQAARTFEGALDGVRTAAESALRVFRDGTLRPDGVEIEFGVKLAAETGAVIAKGSAEGHLVVRLTWSPSPAPARDGEGPARRGAGRDAPAEPSSAPAEAPAGAPEPSAARPGTSAAS